MMRVGNAKTVQATALQHLNAGADVVVAICFSQGAKMGVAVYDSFRKPQTLQIAEYPAQQYNGGVDFLKRFLELLVCTTAGNCYASSTYLPTAGVSTGTGDPYVDRDVFEADSADEARHSNVTGDNKVHSGITGAYKVHSSISTVTDGAAVNMIEALTIILLLPSNTNSTLLRAVQSVVASFTDSSTSLRKANDAHGQSSLQTTTTTTTTT
eukprot:Lankesteria_metandrocarpae@DN4263_c1_g1_i1.p1